MPRLKWEPKRFVDKLTRLLTGCHRTKICCQILRFQTEVGSAIARPAGPTTLAHHEENRKPVFLPQESIKTVNNSTDEIKHTRLTYLIFPKNRGESDKFSWHCLLRVTLCNLHTWSIRESLKKSQLWLFQIYFAHDPSSPPVYKFYAFFSEPGKS